MYNFDFRPLFITLFFTGAALVGLVWFISASSGREIRSRKKIVPTYQLVVENNKVDTIWIYKR